MHKDIVTMTEVERPQGEPFIVYFSSKSNNTHRFVEKLGIKNARIPISLDETLQVEQDYILISPTYGGGGKETKGAVPKQVIHFLNEAENRKHCKGVVASGNTNFGDTFALAGILLSNKLNVPLLYQFELLGTAEDVKNMRKIASEFWQAADSKLETAAADLA